MSVTHYHTLIGGFHQRYSMPSNGLAGIRSDLLNLYGRSLSSCLSDVDYIPWYTRSVDYARYMYTNGDFRGPVPGTRVHLAGYSYGGMTAVDICHALQSLGVLVDRLTLVDPVKRRSMMPWGWLSAFNRFAIIDVPANVKELHWFFQRQNWPRSHHLNTHPKTMVNSQELKLKHTACDNASVVREAIIKQAESLHDTAP